MTRRSPTDPLLADPAWARSPTPVPRPAPTPTPALGSPEEPDPVALEEAALAEREAEMGDREAVVSRTEAAALADQAGIEGRCRVLQRKIRALVAAGVEEAASLALHLPRPAPPPSFAERRRALNMRRAALDARETAVRRREEAAGHLLAHVRRARGALADVEARLATLAATAPGPLPAVSSGPDRSPPVEGGTLAPARTPHIAERWRVGDLPADGTPSITHRWGRGASASDGFDPPAAAAPSPAEVASAPEGTPRPAPVARTGPPPIPDAALGRDPAPMPPARATPARADAAPASSPTPNAIHRPPGPQGRPEAANGREERRRGQRARLDCAVGLETPTNFFTGFVRDISDGGLFVATFDTLPIGTVLDVGFDLPDGTHVEARARVQWVREMEEGGGDDVWPGMGLRFESLSPDAAAAIQAFMRRREPLFFPD